MGFINIIIIYGTKDEYLKKEGVGNEGKGAWEGEKGGGPTRFILETNISVVACIL